MKKLNLFYAGLLILMGTSCQNTEPTTLWVNSFKADSCLLIQKGDSLQSGNWENYQGKITGFDFVPGNIYKIEVNAAPNTIDESSEAKYSLIKIISEEPDNKVFINGKWRMTMLIGDTISLYLYDKTHSPTLEINLGKMEFSGNNSCNNFTGKIDLLNEKEIQFAMAASTEMACKDMSIPDLYDESLGKVAQWGESNSRLIFYDSNHKQLFTFERSTKP